MKTLHISLTSIFFISFLSLVHSQYHPKGEFSSVDITNTQNFKPLGSTFSSNIRFNDHNNSFQAGISYGHYPAADTGKLILQKGTTSKVLIGSNNVEIRSSSLSLNVSQTVSFKNGIIDQNGKVSVGTTQITTTLGGADLSSYKLFVNGGVLAKEVRVRTDWADYVFDPSYSLRSLPAVETFIQQHGHLPNVPNATTVAEEGIEIGDMTRIQQEKIEELTLYTIQQDKQITTQQARIEALEGRLAKLETLLNK